MKRRASSQGHTELWRQKFKWSNAQLLSYGGIRTDGQTDETDSKILLRNIRSIITIILLPYACYVFCFFSLPCHHFKRHFYYVANLKFAILSLMGFLVFISLFFRLQYLVFALRRLLLEASTSNLPFLKGSSSLVYYSLRVKENKFWFFCLYWPP